MRAVSDEFFKPFACLRNGIGARDAERVEALRARGFAQRLFEMMRIVQKSRSA